MAGDEKFNSLMKEYISSGGTDSWYGFLSSRGIKRPVGPYVIYADKIEQEKKDKVRRVIQDEIDKASYGTSVESAEINVAKGEILAQVIEVVGKVREEKNPEKQIRVLERAWGILNAKDIKKRDKIKVKLTDMLGEDEKQEMGKVLNMNK